MVRATFRLPFGGHSPANRDRLCARRGQPQRISPPRLVVASPDRRSRICPCLLHEPGFEKLGDGPLGPAALWTLRGNQAMITALRGSAEKNKLLVVEFDGHV